MSLATELGWGDAQRQEMRMLGCDLLREGKYEKATALFEGVVELGSDEVFDLQTLGALYVQLGRWEEALHHLNQAAMRNEKHLPTRLNQAKALVGLERLEEGLEIARRLMGCRNERIREWAEALLLAHDPELRQALEQSPSHCPLLDCSREEERGPSNSNSDSQETDFPLVI